jgi:WXXGXW repeat (2 copies)
MKNRLISFATGALLLCSAMGCARNLEPKGTPNEALIVPSEPPSSRADTTSAPPGPGHTWVGGHWAWNNEQWAWVGGHWEKNKAGHSFVQPRYEDRNGTKVYVLGGWVPASGAASDVAP